MSGKPLGPVHYFSETKLCHLLVDLPKFGYQIDLIAQYEEFIRAMERFGSFDLPLLIVNRGEVAPDKDTDLLVSW